MSGFACPVIDPYLTGKNIKEIREEKGMTVKDLQEILGLSSPQAIYKWQWGQTLPDISNLIFLALIWNVRIEDILVLKNEDVFLFHSKCSATSFRKSMIVRCWGHTPSHCPHCMHADALPNCAARFS